MSQYQNSFRESPESQPPEFRASASARRSAFVIWIVMGVLLAVVVPIAGTTLFATLLPEFRLPHLPVHSLIEISGGLIAVAIAGILIVEARRKVDVGHYSWIAAGLTGMGLLDVVHGAVPLGNVFIWLRAVATCVGGLCFAVVWLRPFGPRRAPTAAMVIAITVSLVSVTAEGYLPAMKSESGGFTWTPLLMNVIGGGAFFVAVPFFLKRYRRTGDVENWLFAVQATLFGLGGVLFPYSVLWDGAWWWWHLMRLAAYVIALAHGLRAFLEAERDLRRLNSELLRSNLTLDRTVEERTAELRAIEERFELAVRGSMDGLWDWNTLTSDVYYSPRFKQMLGYQEHELPNLFESFETRLHPEDHDWVLKAVDDHIKQRVPYDVEYRLRAKSGEYRWFRARGQAVWNEAGQAVRMAGSITDTTEARRLRERFRLSVEASPAALLMVTRDGRISLANSGALVTFGYMEEELLGQPIEVLIPERFRPGHPAKRNLFFQRPAARAMGAELELVALHKTGREFPVKVGLSPVQTEEGPAVICGVLDISDQKRALESMRVAKDAAESASRAKSSFLANMSHEIRTPMNGILGMAQLLAQTDLKVVQRDYLKTIDESAHILLRLLNDILDFSKIEAGKLELESIDFRLSECVARASQMMTLRAAEKGLDIVCRIAPEIPDHLKGDPGRLRQVLVNLLSNAVKFTETGELFVNVNVERADAETVRLLFSVSDTGIGIPADKLEQIFAPFEQAESSTTRRFGGTGLGLTITRQLVEMMRGQIRVESEEGRGSTFRFTAEFEIGPHNHVLQPVELKMLSGLPVLVVDDNVTNRRVFNELLMYWKMQPILVDSAEAARRAVTKAEQSGHPIRLILLDHMMPNEDGFHFVESLNQMNQGQHCPIIMISSANSPQDSERCQSLGIRRLLLKPVIASELLTEILHLFGDAPSVAATPYPVSDQFEAIQPRRVLLVEDNEINRRVATGLLAKRGHQFVCAENGKEAFDLIAEQEFDVVLMDMQMPVMDGYEATIAIRRREHQTGGHLPIIAMTAEALKGDRERCLEAGMDDYVSKPVDALEMYRAIEKFPAVCRADSRSMDEESALRSAAVEPSQPSAASAAIDWSIAEQRIPGGREAVRELGQLFNEQSVKLMSELREAMASNNAVTLRRAAHTLKGSSVYFGAESLSQAALALEMIGRSDDLKDAPAAFEVLEAELTRMLAALNAGPPR